MPIKITYDQVLQGVELKYTGIVNAAEIFEAMDSVYTNENCINLKYCISDRTSCEKMDVEIFDIDKIIAQTKSLKNVNPNLIVAMVSPDDVNFGLSRMIEMKGYKLGFTIMVFRDRKDADIWIKDGLENS